MFNFQFNSQFISDRQACVAMAEHSGGVASLSAEFLMTTDPDHAADTCPSLVTSHSQGHGDPSSHVLRYALCIVIIHVTVRFLAALFLMMVFTVGIP